MGRGKADPVRSRRRTGLLLGSLLALLLAVPASAGGWATASLDDGGPPSPTVGEPIQIGFMLHQHGRTPISWEKASVAATNPETGESVDAEARPEGRTGHYVAELTFPSPGTWEWEIRTSQLKMETRLQPLILRSAPAALAGGGGTKAGEAAVSSAPEAGRMPDALALAFFLAGVVVGAITTLGLSSALAGRRPVAGPRIAATR